MAEKRDLYQDWLGLAPGVRPPEPHVLLGVKEDCKDLAEIDQAAHRQLGKLDRYAIHRDAALRGECQRLMNEVARARTVLHAAASLKPAAVAERPPVANPGKKVRAAWGAAVAATSEGADVSEMKTAKLVLGGSLALLALCAVAAVVMMMRSGGTRARPEIAATTLPRATATTPKVVATPATGPTRMSVMDSGGGRVGIAGVGSGTELEMDATEPGRFNKWIAAVADNVPEKLLAIPLEDGKTAGPKREERTAWLEAKMVGKTIQCELPAVDVVATSAYGWRTLHQSYVISMETASGRKYTFRVVGEELTTSANNEDELAAAKQKLAEEMAKCKGFIISGTIMSVASWRETDLAMVVTLKDLTVEPLLPQGMATAADTTGPRGVGVTRGGSVPKGAGGAAVIGPDEFKPWIEATVMKLSERALAKPLGAEDTTEMMEQQKTSYRQRVLCGLMQGQNISCNLPVANVLMQDWGKRVLVVTYALSGRTADGRRYEFVVSGPPIPTDAKTREEHELAYQKLTKELGHRQLYTIEGRISHVVSERAYHVNLAVDLEHCTIKPYWPAGTAPKPGAPTIASAATTGPAEIGPATQATAIAPASEPGMPVNPNPPTAVSTATTAPATVPATQAAVANGNATPPETTATGSATPARRGGGGRRTMEGAGTDPVASGAPRGNRASRGGGAAVPLAPPDAPALKPSEPVFPPTAPHADGRKLITLPNLLDPAEATQHAAGRSQDLPLRAGADMQSATSIGIELAGQGLYKQDGRSFTVTASSEAGVGGRLGLRIYWKEDGAPGAPMEVAAIRLDKSHDKLTIQWLPPLFRSPYYSSTTLCKLIQQSALLVDLADGAPQRLVFQNGPLADPHAPPPAGIPTAPPDKPLYLPALLEPAKAAPEANAHIQDLALPKALLAELPSIQVIGLGFPGGKEELILNSNGRVYTLSTHCEAGVRGRLGVQIYLKQQGAPGAAMRPATVRLDKDREVLTVRWTGNFAASGQADAADLIYSVLQNSVILMDLPDGTTRRLQFQGAPTPAKP